ncbi:hypothetical protein, partial [Klebsiella michiganensis]|uniref:hypothetical protein n=2 Tax=Klebsiella TaxID=570 RepID=UPI0019558BC2
GPGRSRTKASIPAHFPGCGVNALPGHRPADSRRSPGKRSAAREEAALKPQPRRISRVAA